MREWKLQIPGPREVKNLQGYSSTYFSLTAENELRFRLDAAETGTTPNSRYVRSELRHLPDWTLDGVHTLAAEVRVDSRLKPAKVTVLQIHALREQRTYAPPLLRIAVNDGDLVAFIKTTAEGDRNDTVLLRKGLGAEWAQIELAVRARQLRITVNGELMVDRIVSFWDHRNYWKAGCYPQATHGTAEVFFRKLTVN